MKDRIIILIVLFISFMVVIYVLLSFAKIKIGDIRPALLPSKKAIGGSNEVAKTGEQTNLPLKLPNGFQIGIFAKDLGKVRDLEFSEGGILVASIPDEGAVVALPDRDGDGVADEIIRIQERLNNPHGLAFFKGKLFIAEETRLARYTLDEKNLTSSLDKVLFDLPLGGRHITRTIAFNNKDQMFVSIGSTCDVCFEKHPWIGTVIISDSEGKNPRVFAKGLRNAVFITVDPKTQDLWGTEMGRDFLGDEKPPDEINIIRDGGDYGWPICFGDKIYDSEFGQKTPDYCQNTISPIYQIAAHSAPLGLTFINSSQFPEDWQSDLLVAYHGSWNRSTPIGYKVVRMDFEGDKIKDEEDFLTGFLQGSEAAGRPVDLVFDKNGSLFISDDKAGVIYKIIQQSD